MKIYLAGKIGRTDWRHSIVANLRAGPHHDGFYNTSEAYGKPGARWPVMKEAIFGEHDYVGPYFISCDHGCAHGPTSHGVAAGASEVSGREYVEYETYLEYEHSGMDTGEDERGYWIDFYASGCLADRGLTRAATVSLCRSAIRTCDLFFAWANTLDCYGTFVELGYAKARGKKVWVAGQTDFSELWFIYQLADRTCFGCDSAKLALQTLLEQQGTPTVHPYWEPAKVLLN